MVIKGKGGELCKGQRERSTVMEMYEVQLRHLKNKDLLCVDKSMC